jgi:tetratricopeptide (TPR) repeat protein
MGSRSSGRAAFVPLLRAGNEAPELWTTAAPTELDRVHATLTELAQRDFVLKLPDSSMPGSDEYAFKHNKEREMIKSRTTPTAQRRYHAIFADWLDHQGHARSSEEYARDARRAPRARGRRAARRPRVPRGGRRRARVATPRRPRAEHYERGLELLGDSVTGRRIDALHNYGDVLQLSSGRIDDALASFREMLTLAFRLDLRSKGGAAHNRIGRLYRETGSLEEAGTTSRRRSRSFQAARDERGVASSIDDIGKLRVAEGRILPGRARVAA